MGPSYDRITMAYDNTMNDLPRFLIFKDVVFDAEREILLKDGVAKKLEPKQAQLLSLFLNHPGEIISRSFIHEHVWAGVHTVDEVISKTVSHLRGALDDDHKAPKFIETVNAKGYRFLGTIEPPQTSPSAHVGMGTKYLFGALVAGAFIGMALASAYFLLNKEPQQVTHFYGG